MKSGFRQGGNRRPFRRKEEGWQKVAPWYNKITEGGQGHYYHKHVIIPGVLRLLALNQSSKLLDLACGNGVLAQSLPKGVEYVGVDIAESLLRKARFGDKNTSHKYIYGDVAKPLPFRSLGEGGPIFTHATIILALQNIKDPNAVIKNASKLLDINSKLLIIMNHPMFRIPRQSSWGLDESRKIQYRRIDRYMSPMEIPVNPTDYKSGGQNSTMSYHYPLSHFINALKNSGFLIENIEEWTSDKESVGRAGKMENRARNEIPLFMAILAVKK